MADFQGLISLPYKKMNKRKLGLHPMTRSKGQLEEKYSMIQIRNNVLRRKKTKMRTLNQRCIDAYNAKWTRCLLLEDDIYTTANDIFEFSANASEIVGYYLETYGPEAHDIWISNTKGKEKTGLDKEVDHLFYQIKEGRERSHTLS